MRVFVLKVVALIAIVASASAEPPGAKLKSYSVPGTLPRTNAYKMVDGDPVKLIARYCDLETLSQAISCSVWVQPDKSGSLVGYLTVMSYKDGRSTFQSDTVTSDGRACLIGGNFDGEKFDAMADFRQRSSFETKDALGMLYLKREGVHMEVNDERWNYCYKNKHLSDVWHLLGTQVR